MPRHKAHLLLMVGVLLGMATVGNAAMALVDVHIATNATGATSWNGATTPASVAHNTAVTLRVVFEMADGETTTYHWLHPQANVANLDGGNRAVLQWPVPPGCTSTVTVQWQRVMPEMDPTGTNHNDPWNTNYGFYTNVVANNPGNVAQVDCPCPGTVNYTNPGEGVGLWIAFGVSGAHTCTEKRGVQLREHAAEAANGAIIEYTHTDVAGTSPTVDTNAGVTHYTVAATYLGVTKHSRGKENTPSVSNLVFSGAEVAYNLGIKDVVTRIVRRTNHASTFVQHVEAFNRVPWIYGSIDWQGRDYLGFDCADLAQAAAYNAGLDLVNYESSAATLQTERDAIGAAGEPYTLVNNVLKDKNGNPAAVNIGAGVNDINFGALVMIDYSGDGTATHTTILRTGTGAVDGTDGVVYAGHTGVTTNTLTGVVGAGKIYFRQGW